jgi:hypothetical protein
MNIIARFFQNEISRDEFMYDVGEYAYVINRSKKAIDINKKVLLTGEHIIMPYNSAITMRGMMNWNLEVIAIPKEMTPHENDRTANV